MKDLQREVNVTKQQKADKTKESLKILDRIPPGPDLVQAFWLENLLGRVRSQLKKCLDSGFIG